MAEIKVNRAQREALSKAQQEHAFSVLVKAQVIQEKIPLLPMMMYLRPNSTVRSLRVTGTVLTSVMMSATRHHG